MKEMPWWENPAGILAAIFWAIFITDFVGLLWRNLPLDGLTLAGGVIAFVLAVCCSAVAASKKK